MWPEYAGVGVVEVRVPGLGLAVDGDQEWRVSTEGTGELGE